MAYNGKKAVMPGVLESHGLGLDSRSSALNLKRISAIVVEKNQHLRETVASVLRELGIRDVRAIARLDEALWTFKDRPADIVLADWAPRFDGIELLRRLRHRGSSPDPYVPVIMVTANTEAHHVCYARDFGVTEFVAKPFNARRIYSRIEAVVMKRRLFIQSNSYFGPDRRRRAAERAGDNRRHIEPGRDVIIKDAIAA